MEAAAWIDKRCPHTEALPPPQRKLPASTGIFLLTYHLDRLQNLDIHRVLKKTCNFGAGHGNKGPINPYQSNASYAQDLGIEQLLVALSRPKNLLDLI